MPNITLSPLLPGLTDNTEGTQNPSDKHTNNLETPNLSDKGQHDQNLGGIPALISPEETKPATPPVESLNPMAHHTQGRPPGSHTMINPLPPLNLQLPTETLQQLREVISRAIESISELPLQIRSLMFTLLLTAMTTACLNPQSIEPLTDLYSNPIPGAPSNPIATGQQALTTQQEDRLTPQPTQTTFEKNTSFANRLPYEELEMGFLSFITKCPKTEILLDEAETVNANDLPAITTSLETLHQGTDWLNILNITPETIYYLIMANKANDVSVSQIEQIIHIIQGLASPLVISTGSNQPVKIEPGTYPTIGEFNIFKDGPDMPEPQSFAQRYKIIAGKLTVSEDSGKNNQEDVFIIEPLENQSPELPKTIVLFIVTSNGKANNAEIVHISYLANLLGDDTNPTR